MVHGSRDDAEALREEIAEVLSTMGLRLSPEKTLITHIDQGLESTDGTSSATANEEPGGATSTPTPLAKP